MRRARVIDIAYIAKAQDRGIATDHFHRSFDLSCRKILHITIHVFDRGSGCFFDLVKRLPVPLSNRFTIPNQRSVQLRMLDHSIFDQHRHFIGQAGDHSQILLFHLVKMIERHFGTYVRSFRSSILFHRFRCCSHILRCILRHFSRRLFLGGSRLLLRLL